MRDRWQDEAACLGMDAEVFYPEAEEDAAYEEARSICATCPVRVDCQSEGMREQYGMWGGLTPIERRRALRKKNPSYYKADGSVA